MFKKTATVLVGALLTLGGVVAAPSAAQAATWSVSMQTACDNQIVNVGTAIIQWNVMGWRCKVPTSAGIVYYSIDVARECRRAHNAKADYSNFNDPYSWYCYR